MLKIVGLNPQREVKKQKKNIAETWWKVLRKGIKGSRIWTGVEKNEDERFKSMKE